MAIMHETRILSVHLGAELKGRWREFCAGQGASPSAAVRQVIIKLLGKNKPAEPVFKELVETPDLQRRRVELRLTKSEYECIEQLAGRLDNSPNAWIINLIRANLAHSAQLGMTELRFLGQSNSRLLAIGRNLNQIARWMNANQGSAPPERERIDELYRIILEHTSTVAQVMRANIDRWTIK